MKIVFLGFAAASLLVLPAAAAQVCPNGHLAMFRISTIKPTGTRAGFDKAVTDQIAWYRGHGVTTNRIVEAEVIEYSGSASAKDVATIHYDPPSVTGKQPQVDDGYKAFVKEFRDNSDITTEKLLCLPK